MKNIKSILWVLVLIVAASCTKRVHPSDKGYLSLTLAEPEVSILTKAGTVIDDSYTVVILKDGSEVERTKYSEVKDNFALGVGTYTIYAENITPDESLSMRDGKGEQRFYGESSFTIKAGEVTSVEFSCEMANARVSVGMDESFTRIFKKATITIYKKSESESDNKRSFEYVYDNTVSPVVVPTFDDEDLWTYFVMDTGENSTKLSVVISVVRNDNLQTSYGAEVTLAPKIWHKLNIKSKFIDGDMRLDLYSNDQMQEVTEEWGVNPY